MAETETGLAHAIVSYQYTEPHFLPARITSNNFREPA